MEAEQGESQDYEAAEGLPVIWTKHEGTCIDSMLGCRRGSAPLRCKVSGCTSDLTSAPKTHQRFRLCNLHIKAPVILVDGVASRFCQQCSRFHPLKEFHGSNRTCRMMLIKNRARQRGMGTACTSSLYDSSTAVISAIRKRSLPLVTLPPVLKPAPAAPAPAAVTAAAVAAATRTAATAMEVGPATATATATTDSSWISTHAAARHFARPSPASETPPDAAVAVTPVAQLAKPVSEPLSHAPAAVSKKTATFEPSNRAAVAAAALAPAAVVALAAAAMPHCACVVSDATSHPLPQTPSWGALGAHSTAAGGGEDAPAASTALTATAAGGGMGAVWGGQIHVTADGGAAAAAAGSTAVMAASPATASCISCSSSSVGAQASASAAAPLPCRPPAWATSAEGPAAAAVPAASRLSPFARCSAPSVLCQPNGASGIAWAVAPPSAAISPFLAAALRNRCNGGHSEWLLAGDQLPLQEQQQEQQQQQQQQQRNMLQMLQGRKFMKYGGTAAVVHQPYLCYEPSLQRILQSRQASLPRGASSVGSGGGGGDSGSGGGGDSSSGGGGGPDGVDGDGGGLPRDCDGGWWGTDDGPTDEGFKRSGGYSGGSGGGVNAAAAAACPLFSRMSAPPPQEVASQHQLSAELRCNSTGSIFYRRSAAAAAAGPSVLGAGPRATGGGGSFTGLQSVGSFGSFKRRRSFVFEDAAAATGGDDDGAAASVRHCSSAGPTEPALDAAVAKAVAGAAAAGTTLLPSPFSHGGGLQLQGSLDHHHYYQQQQQQLWQQRQLCHLRQRDNLGGQSSAHDARGASEDRPGSPIGVVRRDFGLVSEDVGSDGGGPAGMVEDGDIGSGGGEKPLQASPMGQRQLALAQGEGSSIGRRSSLAVATAASSPSAAAELFTTCALLPSPFSTATARTAATAACGGVGRDSAPLTPRGATMLVLGALVLDEKAERRGFDSTKGTAAAAAAAATATFATTAAAAGPEGTAGDANAADGGAAKADAVSAASQGDSILIAKLAAEWGSEGKPDSGDDDDDIRVLLGGVLEEVEGLTRHHRDADVAVVPWTTATMTPAVPLRPPPPPQPSAQTEPQVTLLLPPLLPSLITADAATANRSSPGVYGAPSTSSLAAVAPGKIAVTAVAPPGPFTRSSTVAGWVPSSRGGVQGAHAAAIVADAAAAGALAARSPTTGEELVTAAAGSMPLLLQPSPPLLQLQIGGGGAAAGAGGSHPDSFQQLLPMWVRSAQSEPMWSTRSGSTVCRQQQQQQPSAHIQEQLVQLQLQLQLQQQQMLIQQQSILIQQQQQQQQQQQGQQQQQQGQQQQGQQQQQLTLTSTQQETCAAAGAAPALVTAAAAAGAPKGAAVRVPGAESTAAATGDVPAANPIAAVGAVAQSRRQRCVRERERQRDPAVAAVAVGKSSLESSPGSGSSTATRSIRKKAVGEETEEQLQLLLGDLIGGCSTKPAASPPPLPASATIAMTPQVPGQQLLQPGSSAATGGGGAAAVTAAQQVVEQQGTIMRQRPAAAAAAGAGADNGSWPAVKGPGGGAASTCYPLSSYHLTAAATAASASPLRRGEEEGDGAGGSGCGGGGGEGEPRTWQQQQQQVQQLQLPKDYAVASAWTPSAVHVVVPAAAEDGAEGPLLPGGQQVPQLQLQQKQQVEQQHLQCLPQQKEQQLMMQQQQQQQPPGWAGLPCLGVGHQAPGAAVAAAPTTSPFPQLATASSCTCTLTSDVVPTTATAMAITTDTTMNTLAVAAAATASAATPTEVAVVSRTSNATLPEVAASTNNAALQPLPQQHQQQLHALQQQQEQPPPQPQPQPQQMQTSSFVAGHRPTSDADPSMSHNSCRTFPYTSPPELPSSSAGGSPAGAGVAAAASQLPVGGASLPDGDFLDMALLQQRRLWGELRLMHEHQVALMQQQMEQQEVLARLLGLTKASSGGGGSGGEASSLLAQLNCGSGGGGSGGGSGGGGSGGDNNNNRSSCCVLSGDLNGSMQPEFGRWSMPASLTMRGVGVGGTDDSLSLAVLQPPPPPPPQQQQLLLPQSGAVQAPNIAPLQHQHQHQQQEEGLGDGQPPRHPRHPHHPHQRQPPLRHRDRLFVRHSLQPERHRFKRQQQQQQQQQQQRLQQQLPLLRGADTSLAAELLAVDDPVGLF